MISRTGWGLTDAGRTFAEHARAVLDAVERARRETRRSARGDVGQVEIAVLASAFTSVLPRALRALRARRRHLTVHPVEHDRTSDTVAAVLDGSADLAFGRPPLSTGRRPGALLALPLV